MLPKPRSSATSSIQHGEPDAALAAAGVVVWEGGRERIPGRPRRLTAMTTFSGAALNGPVTPSDLLRPGLEADPDGRALVTARGVMSWRQLDRRSTRLAQSLLALGLEPGDRIASLMPNRAALVVHYLACFKAGLVATPLNYRYTPPEIDHALGVSGARASSPTSSGTTTWPRASSPAKLPLGRIRYGPATRRRPISRS